MNQHQEIRSPSLERLRRPAQLSRWDWLWTLLPAAGWIGAFSLREPLIATRCLDAPLECGPQAVYWIDRGAIFLENPAADAWSYVTQNWAGYLALGLPLLWLAFLYRKKRLTLKAAKQALWVDWLLVVQATLWNGWITETLRVTVQRPRPFVYSDPARLGGAVAHYTSFISGHTSFASVAGAILILVLIGRDAPKRFWLPVGGIALSLAFLTGLFRVLAARHFLTDVIAAAVVGSSVAWLVSWLHRSKEGSPGDSQADGIRLASDSASKWDTSSSRA